MSKGCLLILKWGFGRLFCWPSSKWKWSTRRGRRNLKRQQNYAHMVRRRNFIYNSQLKCSCGSKRWPGFLTKKCEFSHCRPDWLNRTIFAHIKFGRGCIPKWKRQSSFFIITRISEPPLTKFYCWDRFRWRRGLRFWNRNRN